MNELPTFWGRNGSTPRSMDDLCDRCGARAIAHQRLRDRDVFVCLNPTGDFRDRIAEAIKRADGKGLEELPGYADVLGDELRQRNTGDIGPIKARMRAFLAGRSGRRAEARQIQRELEEADRKNIEPAREQARERMRAQLLEALRAQRRRPAEDTEEEIVKAAFLGAIDIKTSGRIENAVYLAGPGEIIKWSGVERSPSPMWQSQRLAPLENVQKPTSQPPTVATGPRRYFED